MRLLWVDRCKGILILLVVLGHIAGGAYHLVNQEVGSALKYLYKLIYGFHMPAFFLITGYTTHAHKDHDFAVKNIINKAKRLLIPYYVWGCISVIIWLCLSGHILSVFNAASETGYYATKGETLDGIIRPFVSLVHGGGWPNGEGFRYNSVLWFLPCMFMTWMVFRLCVKFGRWGAGAVIVFMILDMLHIDCEYLPLGLSLVPRYLPYMYCGFLSSKIIFQREGAEVFQSSILVLSAIMIFVYCAIVYFLPDFGVLRETFWGHFVLKVVAMIGCFTIILVSRVVKWKGLCVLGMNSLIIMLLHKFFVVGLETKVKIVREFIGKGSAEAIIASCFMAAMISVACVIIAMPIRKWCPIIIGENCLGGNKK